jgi:transitional endoplasmic reticulum ATPase
MTTQSHSDGSSFPLRIWLDSLLGPRSKLAIEARAKRLEYLQSKFPTVPASRRFSDLNGLPSLRQELLNAGRDAKTSGIFLFGDEANGKSKWAEALIGELELPMIAVERTDVQKLHEPELIAFVSDVLDAAEAAAPCAVFFKAHDSLRSTGSHQQTFSPSEAESEVLDRMLGLREKGVLLIACNDDQDDNRQNWRVLGFNRRIEIPAPDEEARALIIRKALASSGVSFREEEVERVAKQWNDPLMTAWLIEKSATRAAKLAAEQSIECDATMLREGLREQLYCKWPERPDQGALDDLVLNVRTRAALSGVEYRLSNAGDVQLKGGTIPRALLFTGGDCAYRAKVALALATSTKRSFINISGAQLKNNATFWNTRDHAGLLSPCVVFISDADELIGRGAFDADDDASMWLLSRLDEKEHLSRFQDLLWIASTTHESDLYPPTRHLSCFGEHIHFDESDISITANLIERWQTSVGVSRAPDWDPTKVAALLQGLNADAIKAALTIAVDVSLERHAAVSSEVHALSVDDVRRARAQYESATSINKHLFDDFVD